MSRLIKKHLLSLVSPQRATMPDALTLRALMLRFLRNVRKLTAKNQIVAIKISKNRNYLEDFSSLVVHYYSVFS